MLVEPAGLCWLAGRRVASRDGVTWAGEFQRWPALRAVVRDGGTGLSEGIELERTRRREHQAAALEDGLDVFHTPREGAEPYVRPGPRRAEPWSEPTRRSNGSIGGPARGDPTAAMGHR
jgi:hypothetical protein